MKKLRVLLSVAAIAFAGVWAFATTASQKPFIGGVPVSDAKGKECLQDGVCTNDGNPKVCEANKIVYNIFDNETCPDPASGEWSEN